MGSDNPTAVVEPSDRPTVDRPLSMIAEVTGGLNASDGAVLPRGTSVGRYVVIDAVGKGGMGAVFLAYDPELDRRVALKLLRQAGGSGSDSGSDPEQQLLVREAKMMAKLSHPNVVSVFDVGTHAGQVFVAMEYVEGVTLREWLEDREWSWRDILITFIEAGRGLAAAHQIGIVHRDFKPGNVMVDLKGRCRVLDFGLALPEEADFHQPMHSSDNIQIPREDLDVSGDSEVPDVVVGTPPYMSPEQWLGAQLDARSDQFSFCIALWDALYGGKPFEGPHLRALRRAVLRGKPGEPKTMRGPAALRRHLMRGLSVGRDERYPRMEDLLDDLERAMGGARRRVMAASVGVGGVALLGLGYAAADAGRDDGGVVPCQDAAARIEPAWNPGRRSAVGKAFEATQAPYAPRVLQTVLAGLDRYARQWEQMYVDACQATHVRAEQSEELMDRRMFCLDNARRDLDATVALFEDADAPVVQSAVKSVEGLPSVDHCSYAAVSSSRIAPPPPELAAEVEALYADITRARAAGLGGRPVEADEDLSALIERARKLAYEHPLRKALIFQSDIRVQNGRAQEVPPLAHEALEVSIRIGDEEGATRSAAMLVGAYAISAQPEEAALWLRYSHAWIDRQGSEDWMPELATMLDLNEGLAHHLAGRSDEAREMYEAALARAREIWPDSTLRIANMLNNLGSLAGMQGRHEKSLEYLEEAYAIYLQNVGAEHPMAAMARSNMAGAKLAQGDVEGARADFEAVLSIRRRAFGDDNVDVGSAHHNLASVLASLDRHEESLQHSQKAFEIKKKALGLDHPSVAVSESSYGSTLSLLGRHEEGLVHTGAAVEVLRKLGENHPYLLTAELAHGIVLQELGRAREATVLLRKVVEAHTKSSHDARQWAEAEFALARALHSQGVGADEVPALVASAKARLETLGGSARSELERLEAWDARR